MRYALINIASGLVENVIELDADSNWPIPDGYIVVQSDICSPGWDYINGELVAPPPPVPTPEQILQANTNMQYGLKQVAAQAMTPFMVALNLGNATDDDTVRAKAWQAYYRVLQAMDLTVENPIWPVAPTT